MSYEYSWEDEAWVLTLKISIIIFISKVWKIAQERSYFKKLNKGDAKTH